MSLGQKKKEGIIYEFVKTSNLEARTDLFFIVSQANIYFNLLKR